MDAFENFRNSLSKYLAIPPTQWLHLLPHLGLKKLAKNELYYSQGTKYEEIGFVVKGIVYNYYTNTKGDEFVKNFVTEGTPVASYISLIHDLPASYSCKAIEETILVTLKYSRLQELYGKHSCWERMGRLNAENCYYETELREQQLLTLDASERYELFKEKYPSLMNRVPQFLIASYVGVSPVTLSRIRGKQ